MLAYERAAGPLALGSLFPLPSLLRRFVRCALTPYFRTTGLGGICGRLAFRRQHPSSNRQLPGTYSDALNSIFGLIKECEEDRDVMSLLNGPVCHADFKRLN